MTTAYLRCTTLAGGANADGASPVGRTTIGSGKSTRASGLTGIGEVATLIDGPPEEDADGEDRVGFKSAGNGGVGFKPRSELGRDVTSGELKVQQIITFV